MLAIVVLPAGLTNTFGRMIQRPRAGCVLLWIMVALFSADLVVSGAAEQSGNPQLISSAECDASAK
jgi:K+-transporting ATPase ATPase A chain